MGEELPSWLRLIPERTMELADGPICGLSSGMPEKEE